MVKQVERAFDDNSSDIAHQYNYFNLTNLTGYSYLGYEEDLGLGEKADELFNNPIGVVTIVLCFLGLTGNVLSIAATANIPNGQTTHSKLIISLGVSDILIIFSVVFNDLVLLFATNNIQFFCLRVVGKTLLDTGLLATLLNLFFMAFDHFTAILKPFWYHKFMRTSCGNSLLTFIWIVSGGGGLLDILVGFFHNSGENNTNLCERSFSDTFDFELIILGFIPIVLTVISVIYIQIYRVVKMVIKRELRICDDEMHSRKAMITTCLIIGTFALCWLPFTVFHLWIVVKMRTDYLSIVENYQLIIQLHKIFFIMMLSNALCDPVIYAVRLRKVQIGYRRVMNRLYPKCWNQVRIQNFVALNIQCPERTTGAEATILQLCNHDQGHENTDNSQKSLISQSHTPVTDILLTVRTDNHFVEVDEKCQICLTLGSGGTESHFQTTRM